MYRECSKKPLRHGLSTEVTSHVSSSEECDYGGFPTRGDIIPVAGLSEASGSHDNLCLSHCL